MASSHNNRAYTLLKRYGYTYDCVERRLTRQITRDFCGFADILAFRPILGSDLVKYPALIQPDTHDIFQGILAIQVCSYTTVNAHLNKIIKGDPAQPLIDWIECGNRFELWAFAPPSSKRVKGRKYPPRFVEVGLERRHQVRALDPLWDRTELQLFGYSDRRLSPT